MATPLHLSGNIHKGNIPMAWGHWAENGGAGGQEGRTTAAAQDQEPRAGSPCHRRPSLTSRHATQHEGHAVPDVPSVVISTSRSTHRSPSLHLWSSSPQVLASDFMQVGHCVSPVPSFGRSSGGVGSHTSSSLQNLFENKTCCCPVTRTAKLKGVPAGRVEQNFS